MAMIDGTSNINYRNIFPNILLSIVIFIMSIMILEITLYFYPALIPSGIIYKMSNKRIIKKYGIDTTLIVDKIDYSPWVKFKPDVEVIDALRPNEVSTFVSRWRTDSRGFKNPPETFSYKISAVTLGDSHVEGVGVSPNQTFASLLSTKYSLNTYNLGVQGYGPQQMLDVYSNYGASLNPKYVIFCFNGSLFKRAEFLEKRQLTGGISFKLRLDEMRTKSSVISESVFLTGLKSFLIDKLIRHKDEYVFNPYSDSSSYEEFMKYLSSHLNYHLSTNYNDLDTIRALELSMKITKNTIIKFAEVVNNNKSIPIVFIMPTYRYLIEIIYPENYMDIINNSLIEIEYKANKEINKFCKENNILVIDGITPLRQYLKKYRSQKELPVDYTKFPFFKIDGHPSQIAHKIYAKAIIEYLNHHEEIIKCK